MKREEFARLFPMGLPTDRFIPNTLRTYGAAILTKPDFPHQEFHNRQVKENAFALAWAMGITQKRDLEIFHASYDVHDRGYGFVDTGQLQPSDHHLGSWLIALKMYEGFEWNKVVAKTVLLHSKDVLPRSAPIYAWILQAADRAAGMGWTGILRDAYYLGFRHPNLQVVEKLKAPWEKGYPKSIAAVQRVCYENVFPFLIKNNVVGKMVKKYLDHRDQFFGLPNGKGGWKVGPLLPVAQEIFYDLFAQTEVFTLQLAEQDLVRVFGPTVLNTLRDPSALAELDRILALLPPHPHK